MKPLILKPIYVEKPWGIQNITKTRVGEEWDLVLNDNKSTSFMNYDKNLKQIFSDNDLCKKILGKKYIKIKKFPVIIKKLYLDGQLSLQLHPDNKFANKYENCSGKNELWYIMKTDDKTFANIGIKEKLKKKKIKQLIKEEKIDNYLNNNKLTNGDIIEIPAGTIHSIKGRAIVYEIQQNSEITYRIKDYNGRKLDLEKASRAFKNKRIRIKQKEQRLITKNKNFKLRKVKITDWCEFKNNNIFKMITVIKGKGILKTNIELKICEGMTILIPACINQYYIEGKIEILIYN